MKRILATISIVTALTGATVFAQPGGRMGMGGAPGISAGMAKFFGNNTSFSSKVDATVTGASQPEPMSMQMNIAMLEGKTRVDLDMTTIKSGKVPPTAGAQMKQMGMDKTVNIIRPDKKMSYTIFPGLNAYAETALSDKQVADAMNDSKIEKTAMGKETIDGHPCQKNKVIVSSDTGEKHEVLVWNAADMKDFPIQMQMNENGNTILMKYKDVKFTKPDAALFDPPAGLTKYDDVQTMMRTEMMKKLGGRLPAPSPK